jgi:hypothetical protein
MYKHVALLLILGVAGAAAQMRTNKPLLEAIEGNAQLSQLAAAIKTVSTAPRSDGHGRRATYPTCTQLSVA